MATYTGINAFGTAVSVVYTPTGGSPQQIAGLLDFQPQGEKRDDITFTPLDTAQAGNEQLIGGKFPVTKCTGKCTYSSAKYAAMQTYCRGTTGTLVTTFSDNGTLRSENCVWTDHSIEKLDATAVQTINFEVTTPAGAVFVSGSSS